MPPCPLIYIKMNFKLTFAVAFLAVALLALVPAGNADCCYVRFKYRNLNNELVRRCEDCSLLTGWYCAAGSGGCNMFGCNCEGGCRKPKEGINCSFRSYRKARNADDFMDVPLMGNITVNDVMNYVDTNKDGRLDEVEITIFVTRHGLPADAWRHLDVDGDDHLTAHEIDSDLVPLATDIV